MTFQTMLWMVDGNTWNSQLARQMLYAATQGQQGIVGATDLIVNATSPNSAGLWVLPGSCVIAGQETPNQGSYWGFNVGNDTTLSIAPTGGSPRTDMIAVEVQDPTWPGSPWGIPASGQIIYPIVIPGVSPSATQPPPGISAIPLALVNMPANTSIVQQAYITDLRQVGNPRRQRAMQALQGVWSVTPSNSPVSSAIVAWPASASWQIAIPSWCTQMLIEFQIGEGAFIQGGSGSQYAQGTVYPIIGTSLGAPLVAWPSTNTNVAIAAGTNSRHTFAGGGQVFIPPSLRGTTQTLQFAAAGSTATGFIQLDGNSALMMDYEFLQQASLT